MVLSQLHPNQVRIFLSSQTECKFSVYKAVKINTDMYKSVNPAAPREVNLPTDHSVSKIDDKIIINCISSGLDKESKNL